MIVKIPDLMIAICGKLAWLIILLSCACPLFAREAFVVAGDVEGLRDAINEANAADTFTIINIIIEDDGITDFVFEDFDPQTGTALPDISANVAIQRAFQPEFTDVKLTFRPSEELKGEFQLVRIRDEGNVSLNSLIIRDFGESNASGGAIQVFSQAKLSVVGCIFEDNNAGENGGAIWVLLGGQLEVLASTFENNITGFFGGAIAVEGDASLTVKYSYFSDNFAGDSGSDLYVDAEPAESTDHLIGTSTFENRGDVPSILVGRGSPDIISNTIFGGGNLLEATDELRASGNITDNQQFPLPLAASADKPMSSCIGSSANFVSLGHNLSSDNTCGFNQATDLVDTDPLLMYINEGVLGLQDGSPAIESGATEVIVPTQGALAILPCGYVDTAGTGRPQDSNNDGVYECDRGAWEKPGPGQIVDGHSGAFFNASRDGEGTYVEILNESTAIVYTFTYRPDGSGPAWFIGVGEIRGNSIVIDDLLRPIGTSFGAGFDTEDIEFTSNGGMSMVFNDCAAAASGGSVAFSGDTDLGYEGLLTRASRLEHITGCGNETPSENAGRSGSYFDPARNGEGVIVQWLTSGQVLVVFFTFDQNDNQLWLIGIGTPNGNSVTMDALHASSFTPWGRNYDPDAVNITNWGTFTLTWTGCDSLVFDYSSTVSGYGMDTRNYSRLSSLAGTSCN